MEEMLLSQAAKAVEDEGRWRGWGWNCRLRGGGEEVR